MEQQIRAAIAGSIAWTYYRLGRGFYERADDFQSDARPGHVWPHSCERIVAGYQIDAMLPPDFVEVIDKFDEQCAERAAKRQG